MIFFPIKESKTYPVPSSLPGLPKESGRLGFRRQSMSISANQSMSTPCIVQCHRQCHHCLTLFQDNLYQPPPANYAMGAALTADEILDNESFEDGMG